LQIIPHSLNTALAGNRARMGLMKDRPAAVLLKACPRSAGFALELYLIDSKRLKKSFNFRPAYVGLCRLCKNIVQGLFLFVVRVATLSMEPGNPDKLHSLL